MALDLNKRSEQANELSTLQVDQNWTDIEEAINSQQPNPNAVTIENEYSAISGVFGEDLLASQSQQTTGVIQFVEDASDDPRVGFPYYAYYEKLEATTGDLSDYRVLSTNETAEIQGAAQKVADQNGNEFSTALKVIYGYGFVVKPLAGGGYILKRKEIFEKIDTASGNINIDFNKDTYYLNQTAAVSLFITNPPLEGESKTVTVDINNPSAFPLTIPPSISHEINDAPSEDYIQLVIQWLESGKVKLQYNTIA